MHKNHPGQTRCPKCRANLWIYPDRGPTVRCVCAHEFIPDHLTQYKTGEDKRREQEDAERV